MARRKKDRKYTRKNIVCIKLSDIELECLESSAETAGITRSEYIRRSILQQEISLNYQVVYDMDNIKLLAGEFGKIGSNLNQIARYFHTGGTRSMAMEDEIRECISELFKLRKDVIRLVGDYSGNIETYKKSKR